MSTPTQYFKRSPVVTSFAGDFQRIDSAYIRLQDARHYSNKKSSNATEIVCSSFGLITTLLRRSSSLESSEFISPLRDLLNIVDLSNISVDEENESEAKKRPRASRRLEMPTTQTNKTSSSLAMTPPNSGNSQRAESNISPNPNEISEKEDLDTPEKVLLMKQRSSRVIKDVHDVQPMLVTST